MAIHSRAVNRQCVAIPGNDIAHDMVKSSPLGTAAGENRRCGKGLIAGLQIAECHRNGIGRQSCELRQSCSTCERLAVDFECRGIRGMNHQRTELVAIVIVERVHVDGVVAVGRVHG